MFQRHKKEDKSLITTGLYQALGVVAYCSLVSIIFWKGNQLFGKVSHYWGPVVFLSLFVVSALITALIVFYKPYLMFFEKKQKKAALNTVAWTAAWLLLFVITGLIVFTIN